MGAKIHIVQLSSEQFKGLMTLECNECKSWTYAESHGRNTDELLTIMHLQSEGARADGWQISVKGNRVVCPCCPHNKPRTKYGGGKRFYGKEADKCTYRAIVRYLETVENALSNTTVNEVVFEPVTKGYRCSSCSKLYATYTEAVKCEHAG
jgi:hypothetical protein